jgi:hypothetical protein
MHTSLKTAVTNYLRAGTLAHGTKAEYQTKCPLLALWGQIDGSNSDLFHPCGDTLRWTIADERGE